MKNIKKTIMVTTMAVTMAFSVTGCGEAYQSLVESSVEEGKHEDLDTAEKILNAYMSGDYETFKTFVEEDDNINLMLDALDDENPEGMAAIYQKAYELTKGGEFTLSMEEGEYNSYTILATIKTTDYSDSIATAMVTAADESGEAFADVPSWLMKGLEAGGEAIEQTVEIQVSNGKFSFSNNSELFRVLTGGFYDYIHSTMTTCMANNEYDDRSYILASNGLVDVSLDEYIFPFDGVEYTDEEVEAIINEYAAEYEGVEGLVAAGERMEDGIRLILFINYNIASTYDLERLDMVSGGSGTEISLSASIKNLEETGYTCETTDFGSGALEK